MELQYFEDTLYHVMEFWGCWQSGECLILIKKLDKANGTARTVQAVQNPSPIAAYSLAQRFGFSADDWHQAVATWTQEAPPVLHH